MKWANGGDVMNSTNHILIEDSDSAPGSEHNIELGHLETAREPPKQLMLNCALMNAVILCVSAILRWSAIQVAAAYCDPLKMVMRNTGPKTMCPKTLQCLSRC